MIVLLLANQPERTIRLRMFESTLKSFGYEVIVPSFGTKNWIKIAGLAKKTVKKCRPDIVHVFNVPDVIYHGFTRFKGDYFRSLIYDYRSPWGLEMQQTFGAPGRIFGEHFERNLAKGADVITTVNTPLKNKVAAYAPNKQTEVIPNYPLRSFSDNLEQPLYRLEPEDAPIIFIGRVCTQEGIQKLLGVAKAIPYQEFWIVGSGPFAWWYLWRKPHNIKNLGWQPHEKMAGLVQKARLCIIPREESVITPYSTDKSVWKLNEYLNMGKLVVASGISQEQPRKNLIIVDSRDLKDAVVEHLNKRPEKLTEKDYRYWDCNIETIRSIYEILT
ncbi:MAG: glycosyltransferase [Methanotrichaceae archaeon]|nr:glycosyltransferase [Methanotrichaceae archaeon]